MPKQQMVATGRNPKTKPKPKGRARPSTLKMNRDSATPRANGTVPRLKLKVNIPRGDGRDQQGVANLPGLHSDEDAEQRSGDAMEEENELPVAQGARRSGRISKSTRHDDFAYSDAAIDLSSVGKADDDYTEARYQNFPGSPITLSEQRYNETPSKLQQPKRRLGRPMGSKISMPSLAPVPEALLYEDIMDSSSPTPEHTRRPTKFEPDEEVYKIVAHLSKPGRVHIDLPDLVQINTGGKEKPYTAKFLMDLYIIAYKGSQWNLCDLVADTWIRAFHAKRRREERTGKETELTWRFNSALYSRRGDGKKGFDPKAPNYSRELHVEDPQLEPEVTTFSRELLDTLYTETERQCVARNLWAEAMALCGRKLENKMQVDKRQQNKWNDSLVYDIMCTALRMTRRKLTLKIEEATEGAWCKRYHMHTAHGRPCYRKLAYDRKIAGDDTSDEDEPEGVPMVLVMEQDLGMAGKRVFGDMDDGEGMMSMPKHVRSEAPVMVDEDAEGETDEG